MNHAEMDELYELYVLGALEREEAKEIDAHLKEECAYCLEHVRKALETTAGLSGMVELVEPPRALRGRVASSVRPARESRPWRMALAALSAACVALIVYSFWSTGEMHRMQGEASALKGERDELRSAIELLTQSDTRAVQFGKTEEAPHGRVLVSSTGGVVFVGSQLPVLAKDKVFELWLIPAKGAPEPAGLFRPNASGNSVHISPVAADLRTTAAVAVTVEPLTGSSAPTTKPFVVVPLG
jgi:anti-sigma-K factor RskA